MEAFDPVLLEDISVDALVVLLLMKSELVREPPMLARLSSGEEMGSGLPGCCYSKNDFC